MHAVPLISPVTQFLRHLCFASVHWGIPQLHELFNSKYSVLRVEVCSTTNDPDFNDQVNTKRGFSNRVMSGQFLAREIGNQA